MTDLPFTATTSADQNWVLNPTQCHLNTVNGKGRGVFAAQAIASGAVIEISPVLLFNKQEYDAHGPLDHGPLDHCTFNWRDGKVALALGLGSLFNHAENPNVSSLMDISRERIVYTSIRAIQPDEELCIFRGRFDPIDDSSRRAPDRESDPRSVVNVQEHVNARILNTFPDQRNDANDIVDEAELPFKWNKLALEREEERPEDIELVQAWVVDIPDQTHIATMLRWLKQAGLDKDELSHLKRIGRRGPLNTLLLDVSSSPPLLPPSPPLDSPYQLPVPRHAARTSTSLSLKNTFWPTVFAPKRKWEPEPWTRAKVRWASEAVRRLKQAHVKVASSASGELPVVAHVPEPYPSDEAHLMRAFFGYDTRSATRHPLRHAVLDVIRQVADDRIQRSVDEPEDLPAENGAQYLLTGRTLFMTHEPCVMCAMALLHSRVKEVFYLVPTPRTGGCGGLACVPALKGVNHRFSIAVWKEESDDDWPRPLDTATDV